jgi:hypothetical protein
MEDYPFQVTLGSIVFLVDGLMEDVVAWAAKHTHSFIEVMSMYNGELVYCTPFEGEVTVWEMS